MSERQNPRRLLCKLLLSACSIGETEGKERGHDNTANPGSSTDSGSGTARRRIISAARLCGAANTTHERDEHK